MPFVIFTVAQILMKCIASTCIRESNNYIDGGDCDDNVNDSDRS